MSVLQISDARRVIVKIGSSLLYGGAPPRPVLSRFKALSEDIAYLMAERDVILVSSGAVAAGWAVTGAADRPHTLADKQACAAIGQNALMGEWSRALEQHGVKAAQILLTPDDTENRRRWLNARTTIERLLTLGITPVVNENDTVATEELRYGDNDGLAARLAQMTGADLLVLLSDVDGLYDADPQRTPGANRLPIIKEITANITSLARDSQSAVGTGGMASKLSAARIATNAGCDVVIASGAAATPLSRLVRGESGSWFEASDTRENARRAWIASALGAGGALHIDAGAAKALKGGNSLLPIGVTRIEGQFQKGDKVEIIDPNGLKIAIGLAGYPHTEAARILGRHTRDIETHLGYCGPSAIVHRNDMVMNDHAR